MQARITQFACALALAATWAPSAGLADLLNGDFEDGGGSLNNWTVFNNVVPNVLADTTTPYSGTHAVKVFGGFNGNPNYSGIFQGVATPPGLVWQASCNVRHNAGDSIAGTANAVVMKIEFYRVFGAQHGSADFLEEHSITILDGDSPEDRWLFRAFQAPAPAEAVEARIAFVFAQPDNEGGAAFVDAVDLKFAGAGNAWHLVWNDEFLDGTVDSSKWHVEDIHHIKNNELQYYAPDDVYEQNGNLVLRSQERSYWGYDTDGNWRHFDYTSGMVSTYGRFAPAYGRIEIYAKLAGTKGMWPAHWMLSQLGGWPPEIDIMEMTGDAPWRIVMSLHWGPLEPGQLPWEIGQTANTEYWGPDYTQAFHKFAVEWWPDLLVWYIDDVPRFSAARAEVPDEPMYLILNTAVGGDWPGAPDGTSVFPQYHEIDYVRAYVTADAGIGLATITDTMAYSGVADGSIEAGEYIAAFDGINSGLGDRLGENSTLYVDSGADGRLTFALDSANALPTTGSFGVVIYIDSVDEGFPSTRDFTDGADIERLMVSGMGPGGQRADLYFAVGFRADYAICLAPDTARVYELSTGLHTLINGADLGAATDIWSGTDSSYQIDDGTYGQRMREFELRLEDLGLEHGDSFRFIATLLNGAAAYRYDEFVGVASGNWWDGASPGNATVVLKRDDFVQFTTAPPAGDLNGNLIIDTLDFPAFLNCFTGPCALSTCDPPLYGDPGCGFAEFVQDGAVDVLDLRGFQVAFGS